MSKAVMISIQPKWCKLIASGKKTIEVRKTRPKIETPFKCYIYCTQAKYPIDSLRVFPNGRIEGWQIETANILGEYCNQSVIGEFVCDRIEDFYCASVPYQKENNLGYGHFVDNGVYKVDGWFEGVVFERNDRYIDSMLKNKALDEMRLSAQELFDYIGIGKHLYAWHISDLVIYDKPREMGEFRLPCTQKQCASWCKDMKVEHAICLNKGKRFITRPPQSWCYVEAKATYIKRLIREDIKRR